MTSSTAQPVVPDWPIHPLADLFPPMNESEYTALVHDIDAHGQREPITLWRGQVLDGRHRLRACRTLGLVPKVHTLDVNEHEIINVVISLNLHRRHLNESQRAVIAAKLASRPVGTNQHAQLCAPSQAEAAEMLQVSRRTVQHARTVIEKAPEAVPAIERGALAVSAAAQQVRQQRQPRPAQPAENETTILVPAGSRHRRVDLNQVRANASYAIETQAQLIAHYAAAPLPDAMTCRELHEVIAKSLVILRRFDKALIAKAGA